MVVDLEPHEPHQFETAPGLVLDLEISEAEAMKYHGGVPPSRWYTVQCLKCGHPAWVQGETDLSPNSVPDLPFFWQCPGPILAEEEML